MTNCQSWPWIVLLFYLSDVHIAKSALTPNLASIRPIVEPVVVFPPHESILRSSNAHSVCEKDFRLKRHLSQHMDVHNASVLPLNKVVDMWGHICSVCGKDFRLKKYLSRHMNVHSLSNEGIVRLCHTCFVCGKEFPLKRYLSQHMNVHLATQRFNCSVAGCNATFRVKNSLRRHNEIIHKNLARLFSCPSCGRNFSRHQNLEVHKRTHSGEKPYKCLFCDAKSATNYGFRIHMMSQHKSQIVPGTKLCYQQVVAKSNKIYRCKTCGIISATAATLKLHEKSHDSKRPFKCQDCGLMFKLNSHLREHTKIHSWLCPYKCRSCGNMFRQSGQLKTHIQRLHLDEWEMHARTNHCQLVMDRMRESGTSISIPPKLSYHKLRATQTRIRRRKLPTGEGSIQIYLQRPFSCPTCNKRFSRKWEVPHHMDSVHSGLKRYACSHCNKFFSERTNLAQHLRIHTGSRPFICENKGCGKAYRQKKDLSIHQKSCCYSPFESMDTSRPVRCRVVA